MSLYNDLTDVLTPYANKIKEVNESLGNMETATAEDVGKALKAKTVTNGKVTEWEFGEAGETVAVDPTLTIAGDAADAKVVGDRISQMQLTNSMSGNLITFETRKENVVIDIDVSDTEANEFEITVCGKNLVKNHYAGRSGSGTTVVVNDDGSFTLNGTGTKLSFNLCAVADGTMIALPEGNYIAVIEVSGVIGDADNYQVVVENEANDRLCLLGKNDRRKQISGSPARVRFFSGDGNVYENYTIKVMLMIADISDDTFNAYNGNTYVVSIPPNASELANIKLVDGVNNIWSDAGNITVVCTSTAQDVVTELNSRINAMEAGTTTFTDAAIEQSYNLIDESKFQWDTWDSPGGYMSLENGYYFPVVGGLKICTNFQKPTFQFYDSEKTLISTGGGVNRYHLTNVPQNAVWARLYINKTANSIDIRGTVVVYEVPADAISADYQRPWVPPVKIKGDYVEGDIYNTAIPLTLDHDILLASQYRAVRAYNKMRNAFRIATFNILVRHGRSGWSALKQELKDYSIDICAMQEVANTDSETYKRYVQNYLTLNTWQFKYGSEPLFDGTLTGKAVVSMYEIVSTEHYNNSIQGREYIKTVINLPQYKQSLHQFTLSVYSYHGDLAASNRLIEVSEILGTIANDTSDFIVVCGDTNAFASEANEQGKRPTWEAWIAGGFTPIHYGEHRTVTADDDFNSIDQIFMGRNITCADYDIVNSQDYMITDNSGDLVPISDHCMVYADLVFDFDAVLAELNSGN